MIPYGKTYVISEIGCLKESASKLHTIQAFALDLASVCWRKILPKHILFYKKITDRNSTNRQRSYLNKNVTMRTVGAIMMNQKSMR